MEKFKHGISGYRHFKCKCKICTKAASDAHQKWIDTNRKKFNEARRNKYIRKREPLPEHGLNGYKKGCRCEVCKIENKINADHWKETHPDHIQKYKEQKRNRVKQKIEWLRQIKLDIGCVDCGYREHPSALHFDHLRDKKFNICDSGGPIDFDILWEEIEKCEIVCANCHAVRTAERRKK